MKLLPHVDVVGDDTINATMDLADTVVLRTPSAEHLENWIPDGGHVYQPYRCMHGVYRSPEMSQAGIPALLRHRWFHTEERIAVRGTHFVGLVIYASVGDAATYEVISGSEELGALRPTRHDNRRHLIVTEAPLEILDGSIPFAVRATGPGRCYLESVLLLSERPEPSSFAPTIQHLTAVASPDGCSADIHFTTTEPARATVTLTGANGASGAEPPAQRLGQLYPIHTARFAGLEPGARYRAQVRAEAEDGLVAEAAVEVGPAARDDGAQGREAAAVEVPVSLVTAAPASEAAMPITFGVPVAQGSLTGAVTASLRIGGSETDAQARTHSRWPDGSSRWVLVDATLPAGLAPPVDGVVVLQAGEADGEAANGLQCDASAEGVTVTGPLLRVAVTSSGPLPLSLERRVGSGDGGGWQRVLTEGGGLHGALGNGLEIHATRPQDIALEESGAERAVIRYDLPAVDDHGVEHLRSRVRIHVYADQPFVRLVHRTVVVSPVLAAAIGDPDAQASDAQSTRDESPHPHAASAVVEGPGEAASLLLLDRLHLDLPFSDASTVRIAGSDAAADAAAGWRLVHEHELAHEVSGEGGQETRDGRADGHIVVGSDAAPSRRLAVGIRQFWQTYPKALSVDGDGVRVELFPKLSGDPLHEEEKEQHRLYFWCDRERRQYKLKVGTAFTTELLLGVPDKDDHPTAADAWFRWMEAPPRMRPTLSYLNGTHALMGIGAKGPSLDPIYEGKLDRAVDERLTAADRQRLYGYMNFGDTYSGDEAITGTWDNNEYDGPFCFYVEFLRGGNPGWFELAEQAARHLADIDTVNHSPQSADVGGQYMHIPGHMGGYHPPYFRFKLAGSTQIPSHMWVEGSVLHYLLTGDESVRETLALTGEWLTRGLLYFDLKNSRESGWRLIHLCGLLLMDDDQRILNAARVLVEKVLEKQLPTGGWERPLTESHCSCPVPRHYGEAGFMIGILMAGLRRYYAVERDQRVADAIVGGARWLLDNTYVPEVGHFRYTNCPTRSPEADPAQVLQIIEGLVEACALAPDPELRAIIERNMGAISDTNVTCLEIRYVPTMFHRLAELGAAETSTPESA